MKEDRKLPFEKIDVKGGDLTFGQRINLGKILEADGREWEKFMAVFECLHHHKPEIEEYKLLYPYFIEIIEGIRHWLEQESSLLFYEPSAEEISAGIKDFSAKVGEFGTIKTLAKNYAKDPDEILEWKYGKVFGILYTDLEEHKFQKRYQKILEKKYQK
ncbi:MAG: hypothetical protein LUG18_07400 [Candidatus Azobacteroides sp.]|nr:hypothetical protein [Candidatus Azobacteroides sp.]